MNCSSDNVYLSTNCTSIITVITSTAIDLISSNNSLSNYTVNNNESSNSGPDQFYIDFRDHSRFWVQRVLVPIIMIIGVIGNSITIVIMTRRKMRSSTNSYLAALATFDMSYLVFIFLLSLSHYPNIRNIQYYHYWKVWPYAIMIVDTSSNTSIWLTVTFTIERYIAVCHPIKGKVLCTESRAKRVILCVFIICFTFTIPTPFEWTILERFNSTDNTTTLEAAFSPLGQNDLYKTVYYYLNVILFVLIPFLLLAIFNAFLIRSVHVSRKQRDTMIHGDSSKPDPTSKQESRITIMLIAVVILFFLCQLPTACVLMHSVFYTVEDNTNKGLLIRGLGNIFNFLMAINAAGNFVLYCLLSQKYRRTFVTIFCPCFKGKFLQIQSAYQRTVYTQVGDHNIHHFRDNEFNNRINYNQSSRRFSSPRSRNYPANQHFGNTRLSSGSLTPYLSQNTCAIKCSRSANYLQVPTGSSSNLMYESSASVSASSEGDEERDNESDNNKQNNHHSFDTNFKDINPKTLHNSQDVFKNDFKLSQLDCEELSDKNFNNNNNKLFAANYDDLCDSNRASNKTSLEINGSAVMLAKNNINNDCEENVSKLDCDNLHTNVGQVHSSQLNHLDPNCSANQVLTTAVVNNTTQL